MNTNTKNCSYTLILFNYNIYWEKHGVDGTLWDLLYKAEYENKER